MIMKINEILINKCRVVINIMPLMSEKNQFNTTKEMNKLFDSWIKQGGTFIKTDLEDIFPAENTKD